MATNAIGHLRDAARVAPDDPSTVRVTTVAQRIRDAVEALAEPFEFHADRLGTASIPAPAAEAIVSASVQAAVNSVNHAGTGVARAIAVRSVQGGVEVMIADDGVGFDPATVPSERLGVRVSILERVANAGGSASVDSATGEGTVVTVRWPDGQGVTPPEFEAPELTPAGPEVSR
jgi:signal transduction histidine kinase